MNKELQSILKRGTINVIDIKDGVTTVLFVPTEEGALEGYTPIKTSGKSTKEIVNNIKKELDRISFKK